MLNNKHQQLPEPNPEDAARSSTLTEIIKDRIQRNGPLSFKEFMATALYHPQFGYYESPHTFGSTGDFITSAHCGPWFAKMLAKQYQQIATYSGHKNICEFGAGDGTLARDLLLALDETGALPQCYYIIEQSEFLRQQQHQLLASRPKLLNIVSWTNEVPDNFCGFIFANELLDAMPFSRFKKINASTFHECYIDIDNQQLMTTWLPTTQMIPKSITTLELDIGHCFELNLNLSHWLTKLYSHCQEAICLFIDYGIEERSYFARAHEGYARAFYQHRVHDDLILWPGLQDITTHINFTEVAQLAHDTSWDIEGYTNQANFLLDCGISDLILPDYDTEAGILARAQIKKLLLPQEMGEMFKCLALSKNMAIDLIGMQNECSRKL